MPVRPALKPRSESHFVRSQSRAQAQARASHFPPAPIRPTAQSLPAMVPSLRSFRLGGSRKDPSLSPTLSATTQASAFDWGDQERIVIVTRADVSRTHSQGSFKDSMADRRVHRCSYVLL